MTKMSKPVSRRVVLGALGAGAGAMILTPAATAAPAAAGPQKWSGSRSANGWPIGAKSTEHQIEGTNFRVTLATGAPAAVLLHAARRINYELDTLRAGDLVGLSTNRVVESPERSNLLSGTAIHFRPGSFPRGTAQNLFPEEVVVLEDIVAEAGGVLAWGGHLAVPDQGLIYIAQGPSSAGALAGRLDAVDSIDSASGAGAVDAHDPKRRQAAQAFRAKQK